MAGGVGPGSRTAGHSAAASATIVVRMSGAVGRGTAAPPDRGRPEIGPRRAPRLPARRRRPPGASSPTRSCARPKPRLALHATRGHRLRALSRGAEARADYRPPGPRRSQIGNRSTPTSRSASATKPDGPAAAARPPAGTRVALPQLRLALVGAVDKSGQRREAAGRTGRPGTAGQAPDGTVRDDAVEAGRGAGSSELCCFCGQAGRARRSGSHPALRRLDRGGERAQPELGRAPEMPPRPARRVGGRRRPVLRRVPVPTMSMHHLGAQ